MYSKKLLAFGVQRLVQVSRKKIHLVHSYVAIVLTANIHLVTTVTVINWIIRGPMVLLND